jgi:hypothetical protein
MESLFEKRTTKVKRALFGKRKQTGREERGQDRVIEG